MDLKTNSIPGFFLLLGTLQMVLQQHSVGKGLSQRNGCLATQQILGSGNMDASSVQDRPCCTTNQYSFTSFTTTTTSECCDRSSCDGPVPQDIEIEENQTGRRSSSVNIEYIVLYGLLTFAICISALYHPCV